MATTVGTLVVNVIGNAQGLSTSLNAAERQIERFGSRLFSMGARVSAGITLPIVGFVKAVNTIGTEMDSAMTESLAIMKDVSAEMRSEMEKRAIDISKTSKFSAKEIATAYYDLASAGLNAQESMDSIGTVATFAQAGLMKMGEAGEYLAGATMALTPELIGAADKASAMARVGDVLTAANNGALGSIKDFADALTNKMAPAMRAQNMSLEDGVAMLMVYAEQNIRGKAAGQQAYMVLRDLQGAATRAGDAWKKYGISVFDASQNMRRIPDILNMMKKAQEGFSKGQIDEWLKTGKMDEKPENAPMTDKARTQMWKELTMPDRSRAATQYLLGTSEQMDKFAEDLKESMGSAAEVAAKQAQSVSVQWSMALHKVEAAALKLYTAFKPMILDLIKWAGAAADKMGEWADKFAATEPSTKRTLAVIVAMAAAIGPMMVAMGSFALMFAGISGLFATAASGLKLFISYLPGVSSIMSAQGWVWVGTASKTLTDLWTALKLTGLLLKDLVPQLLAMYGIVKILEPAVAKMFDNMAGKKQDDFVGPQISKWEQWIGTLKNIMQVGEDLMRMAQFGWTQIVDLFTNFIIPDIVEAFGHLKNTAFLAMKGIGNAIMFPFEQIAKLLPDFLTNAFGKVVSIIGNLLNGLLDLGMGILRKIGGVITSVGANWLPPEMVEFGRLIKDIAAEDNFHEFWRKAASGLNTYTNSMGMANLGTKDFMGTMSQYYNSHLLPAQNKPGGILGGSGPGAMGSMPQILGMGDDDGNTGTPKTPPIDRVAEAYKQLMGDGKRAWLDMAAAFQKHRTEIVANEEAMERLWDVYKGVRDTLGDSKLKKDLEELFKVKIDIAAFEEFRTNFGSIWDELHGGANVLQKDLGIIDHFAVSMKNMLNQAGMGANVFKPEFFKKYGDAIENLAETYDKQSYGIQILIDEYRVWKKAVTETDDALRLHKLNMDGLTVLYANFANLSADLQDRERDLAMFRMTASQKALKGIEDNTAKMRLEFDKQFAAQAEALKGMTGVQLEEGIKQFEINRKIAEKIIATAKTADIERLASSVVTNELIQRNLQHMSDKAKTAIIRITLDAKEARVYLDQMAEGFGNLAAVFDKDGKGILSWLAKTISLMAEAKTVGADLAVAIITIREAFKGGDFNGATFAAGIIAGFTAITKAIRIMDEATQGATKSQRILGGAMAGAELGGQIGMMFGPVGAAWGKAIGFVVGGIVGAIRKSGVEEEMKRIAESFGTAVSEELAKAIDEEAKNKYGGNRQLAEHMNFGKILEEAGGLSDVNFGHFRDRLRDVFIFMEQGFLTSSEGMKDYSENFATLAEFLTDKGVDLATAFSENFQVMQDMMRRGVIKQKDMARFLDENLSAFVQNMEDVGGVASVAWQNIVTIHAEMAVKSKEMQAFLGTQSAAAGTGFAAGVTALTYKFDGLGDEIKESRKELDKLLDGMDDQVMAQKMRGEMFRGNTYDFGNPALTPELRDAMIKHNELLATQRAGAAANSEELERMGRIILSTFNSSTDAGVEWSVAFEAIGPALDALISGFDTLNLKTSNAGLTGLLAFRNMYTANKQLFDGISGTTAGMIALSKVGGLTDSAFQDIAKSQIELFRRLQGQVAATGGTHIDALRPMVPYLSAARDAAEKYGFKLDAVTQEMVDQAVELGILGPKGKTEAELMEKGFDKVELAIRDMIGTLDRFIARIDGVGSAINNLPQPNIQWPDPPDYSDVGIPIMSAPTGGSTYPVVPEPWMGGGGVTIASEPLQQQPQQQPMMTVINNFQDGSSLDRAKIEKEYVPIIIDAVNNNTYGAGTSMAEAVEKHSV